MYNSEISKDTQLGLKDGKIVHISEIPIKEKGLKCGCICPKCGDELIARKGEIRQHHFAHSNKIECKGAAETALHLFAKEVLLKSNYFTVPSVKSNYVTTKLEDNNLYTIYCHIDGYSNKELEKLYDNLFYENDYNVYDELDKFKIVCLIKEGKYYYDKVVLEKNMKGIIADIVLYKDDKPLAVEIKVTHKVDQLKQNKIKKYNIDTIEIDLSKLDIDYYNFNRKQISDYILNSTEGKIWLFNSKVEKYKLEMLNTIKKTFKKKIEMEKKKKIMQKRKEQFEYKKYKRIVEKKLNPKYQDRIRKVWVNRIEEMNEWKNVSNYLGISLKEVPEYLNQEIKGDIIFKCDRRLWQTKIFASFIYKWKSKGKPTFLKVKNIIDWFKSNKHVNCLVDWNYEWALYNLRQNGEYTDIPTLSDVIYEFLIGLCNYGLMEPSFENHSNTPTYYYSFNKIVEDLVLVPSKDDCDMEKLNLLVTTNNEFNKNILIENGYKYNKDKNNYIKKVSFVEYDKEASILDKLKDIELRVLPCNLENNKKD